MAIDSDLRPPGIAQARAHLPLPPGVRSGWTATLSKVVGGHPSERTPPPVWTILWTVAYRRVPVRDNPVYQSHRDQVFRSWAHLDLNQGPHPYQGCALTRLSYGPERGASVPKGNLARPGTRPATRSHRDRRRWAKLRFHEAATTAERNVRRSSGLSHRRFSTPPLVGVSSQGRPGMRSAGRGVVGECDAVQSPSPGM